MKYITFDIETYIPNGILSSSTSGRLDTKSMNVSVTGAYVSWWDKYLFFWEADTEDFIKLLREADYIVGYNHINFDLAVLQKYANFDLRKLNNYDLLVEFQKQAGHRVKLDNLAKTNLGASKTDSFEQFKTYHIDGKWFELADYCMHDVKLTEELHRMALKQQPIKYSEMLGIKEVSLDLPDLAKKTEGLDVSLF